MTKKNKQTRGATLVEALVASAILSFVIVSILGAVAQQQMTTRHSAEKNVAVFLAEMRLEELLKFPVQQLQEEEYIDYVIHKGNNLVFFSEEDAPPDEQMQFRRTTTIEIDDYGEMADITVMVEYGRKKDLYPYNVILTTRRSANDQ